MPIWERIGTTEIDPAIFAFADGVEAVHSVTVYRDHLSANGKGLKTVPAGMFIARLGSFHRFLPRSRAEDTGFATGSAIGKVSLPQVFVPGDLLRVLMPSVSIAFAGAWLTTDTVTLTIGGAPATYTAGDTILANVVTNIANAINSSGVHGSMVEAVASSTNLILQSKDGISLYPITVAETAAGSATPGAAAFAFTATPIGTVQSVNVDAKTIALTANAAVAVPAGVIIGVSVDEILGIHGKSVDMTIYPSKDIYAARGAHGVYENVLPYLDGDIRRRLPKLTISKKF